MRFSALIVLCLPVACGFSHAAGLPFPLTFHASFDGTLGAAVLVSGYAGDKGAVLAVMNTGEAADARVNSERGSKTT